MVSRYCEIIQSSSRPFADGGFFFCSSAVRLSDGLVFCSWGSGGLRSCSFAVGCSVVSGDGAVSDALLMNGLV